MTIRKEQGFALIDLIFVCGIIGLLCSIALPRLLLAKQAAGAASLTCAQECGATDTSVFTELAMKHSS